MDISVEELPSVMLVGSTLKLPETLEEAAKALNGAIGVIENDSTTNSASMVLNSVFLFMLYLKLDDMFVFINEHYPNAIYKRYERDVL